MTTIPVGTQAQRWVLGRDGDPATLLAQAAHGDLLIDPEGYRSTGVQFVCWKPVESGFERTLVKFDLSGSGYCSVPLAVTRHLPDPPAFYQGRLEYRPYVTKGDWYSIELDSTVHQPLLQRLAGGRPIHPARGVTYLFQVSRGRAGVYLEDRNCLDRNEADVWIRLSKSTTKQFLGPPQAGHRDERVIRAAKKTKVTYEQGFLAYLQALPLGSQIIMTNPPRNPQEDDGSGWGTSVAFDGVEQEAATGDYLVRAHYSYWESDELNSSPPVEALARVVFRPTVRTQYGPFQQIRLWIAALPSREGEGYLPDLRLHPPGS